MMAERVSVELFDAGTMLRNIGATILRTATCYPVPLCYDSCCHHCELPHGQSTVQDIVSDASYTSRAFPGCTTRHSRASKRLQSKTARLNTLLDRRLFDYPIGKHACKIASRGALIASTMIEVGR